jgi:hypothetical protein
LMKLRQSKWSNCRNSRSRVSVTRSEIRKKGPQWWHFWVNRGWCWRSKEVFSKFGGLNCSNGGDMAACQKCRRWWRHGELRSMFCCDRTVLRARSTRTDLAM